MKKKEGFVLREVLGERIIVGEGLGAIDFGHLLCLNETAAWLWQQATGDFTAESLAEKLKEAYDVTEDVALSDTKETIAEWTRLGLIE